MSNNTLISVRVVDDGNKQVLMPWNFVNIPHVSYNYSTLLSDIESGVYPSCKINSRCACGNIVLSHGTASSSFALKEEIRGEPMHDIVDKVTIFGMRFFTLFVKHDEFCPTCNVSESDRSHGMSSLNAFQVMMAAAANNVGRNVPKKIENAKNGFDRLFNCFLEHFSVSKCIFPTNASPAANNFVDTLTKLVWYIDGHHMKIEQELPVSQKIPAVFKDKFSGFNCPEKSKHRKRAIGNLSAPKLERFCIRIKEIIQCLAFLDQAPWNEFTLQIHQLISLIEGYCCHLRSQAKRVSRSENTPRTPLELKTNVTVLKVNKGSVHSSLAGLNNQLSNSGLYNPISVREFLPNGCSRQQVYSIVEILKERGLSSRAVHYVYHTGGPKASLHFVWMVEDGISEGDLLNKCLNIIRNIEQDAPLYERKITKGI